MFGYLFLQHLNNYNIYIKLLIINLKLIQKKYINLLLHKIIKNIKYIFYYLFWFLHEKLS